MTWLLWILLPIVLGFLIGYGTNRVAIAMLFRPRKPRRFVGVTFWGVFPRLQPEFAVQAGELVEREFFSAEALVDHVHAMREHPRLKASVRMLIEQQFERDLGTPEEALNRWLGKDGAAAVRSRLVAAIAAELRSQVGSARGRELLAQVLVPQVETMLKQPLRDVLSDIALHEPPDPSEPERQAEPDRIGRVLGVPKLLRWIAASDVPQTVAERAVGYAHRALMEAGRLSDLLSEESQGRLAEWLAGGAPTLQRTLAEQLQSGTLRKVVLDELRSGVRRKVSGWTSPIPVVGNLVNSERLLGLLDGVLDRVPEELAEVLRAPRSERTLRSMLRSTAYDVMHKEPRQFLTALDESLKPEIIAWLTEQLTKGLDKPSVVAELDDILHESLHETLDEPAGLWLARAWRGLEVSAEEQPERALREVASRSVAHLLDRLDDAALEVDLERFAESLVAELWSRPLGRPRSWLPTFGQEESALVDTLAERVTTTLVDTVEGHLPEVLEALDIKELVRSNIASWEPDKLEEAIYEISKRHLVFVTWFGGFLGAVIGLVQIGLQALR